MPEFITWRVVTTYYLPGKQLLSYYCQNLTHDGQFEPHSPWMSQAQLFLLYRAPWRAKSCVLNSQYSAADGTVLFWNPGSLLHFFFWSLPSTPHIFLTTHISNTRGLQCIRSKRQVYCTTHYTCCSALFFSGPHSYLEASVPITGHLVNDVSRTQRGLPDGTLPSCGRRHEM